MKAKILSGATVAVAAMGLALAGATPAAAKHHKHHGHHKAEKHKCSAKSTCSAKMNKDSAPAGAGAPPAGEPK